MRIKEIKALKPSYNSARIIGREMYEAGAGQFWFYLPENIAGGVGCGENFFQLFFAHRNDAIEYLKTKRYLEIVNWAKNRYTENGVLPLRKYIPGKTTKEIFLTYKRIEDAASKKYIGTQL